jgi:hypothetical protein
MISYGLLRFLGFKAFPIPSDNYITIEINEEITGEALIEIINIFGQQVNSGRKVFLSPANNQFSLDLAGLNPREYYVKIIVRKR